MIWNPMAPPFSATLVVVGGQCRKVGKTALAVDLIQSFRDIEWTAVKITPHCDSGCPVNGPGCGCAANEHAFAIREETSASGATDSGRFLAAGARRSLWVETKSRRLGDALASLNAALERDHAVIIESNAIVEFWRPDAFLMVLDPANPDFKPSAQSALALANAFVLRSPHPENSSSPAASLGIPGRTKFLQPLGQPLPTSMQIFVRQLLVQSRHPT
ncbi:MAG TPA: hypothetical protein VLY23_12825 [Candidatus Acidoferrum sp.]|nr:hypothetical protein [Candidatus Acidoferrum sp.]